MAEGKKSVNLSETVLKLAYTVDEAMALTGIGEETIRAAVKSGNLRAKGIGRGRNYLILPDDLKAWIDGLPDAKAGPNVVMALRARAR